MASNAQSSDAQHVNNEDITPSILIPSNSIDVSTKSTDQVVPSKPIDQVGPSKPTDQVGPPKKRSRSQVVDVAGKEDNNRLRSDAWKHFTIVKGSNPIRANCNYCGKNYAADPSKNGTSNLFFHLENQCLKAPWKTERIQRKMIDIFGKPTDSSKTKSKALDVIDIRKKLASMVITDELPFSIVEGKGFKRLMNALEPKLTLPSRVTIARDCMKLYAEERNKIKKDLKGRRVCLTTDTWTSLQNLNYMVLTVHYVDDDWILQKKLLNFCTIESHKGAMIASKLEDCLNDWGLDKILTLTVDNASSNDVCVQELLRNFKFKDVLLNNRFFHVRCHAHILNLIIKDGLKEHFSSIVRVRNACKYVKSSPARLKSFKQSVEKEKIELSHSIILDVDTRWNSTYMMLDRAEKYEKAFDRLYRKDKNFQDFFDTYDHACDDDGNAISKSKGKIIGPPKKDDWIVARNFVTFLKVFYNVTLKFSTTLDVSANICIPELSKVKHNIESKKNMQSGSNMYSMAISMHAKFDKYWSKWSSFNQLLSVAIVLDPRFKKKGLEHWLTKMFGNEISVMKMDIDDHLDELFLDYSRELSFNDKDRDASLSPCGQMERESEDVFASFAKESGESNNGGLNELNRYLRDGLEVGEGFNVLGWWRSNVHKYPILSSIAKDIFAIPISTVASEQAFSTSGRVIDPCRSSLNPTTVEALMCTQSWLRGTTTPTDFLEALDEAEKYEDIAQESSSSYISKERIEVDYDEVQAHT